MTKLSATVSSFKTARGVSELLWTLLGAATASQLIGTIEESEEWEHDLCNDQTLKKNA